MKNPDLYSFPECSDSQTIHLFEDWIVFITNRFCRSNSIDPYEAEDLRQFVKMRLVEQLPKIKTNFKGEAKLRTYISAIILNLCREFRRVNCSKSVFTSTNLESLTDQLISNGNSSEKNIALKREIEKFNRIILMYGTKKTKVKIALSLYYGLDPGIENLRVYCNENHNIASSAHQEIINAKKRNKKEGLKIFTDLVNQTESKTNTVEASRKWVSRTIDDILKILNCQGGEHTKETLGVLIEMNHLK